MGGSPTATDGSGQCLKSKKRTDLGCKKNDVLNPRFPWMSECVCSMPLYSYEEIGLRVKGLGQDRTFWTLNIFKPHILSELGMIRVGDDRGTKYLKYLQLAWVPVYLVYRDSVSGPSSSAQPHVPTASV